MGRKAKIKREKKEALKKNHEMISGYISESYLHHAKLINLIAILKKENEEMKKKLPKEQLKELENKMLQPEFDDDEEEESEAESESESESETEDDRFVPIKEFITQGCCGNCKKTITLGEIADCLEDLIYSPK